MITSIMSQKTVARAEIPQREWVEFEFETEGEKIVSLKWSAQACHHVLDQAKSFAKEVKNKDFRKFQPRFKKDHAGLLLTEIWLKLRGEFTVASKDLEICHCRKINEDVIDCAVVLGATTPEKVREWTTASSGCGTCRNEVEKIIQRRIK